MLCAGDGIRCYVCNSKQDARCLDPFSSNLTALDTVDCERDNSVRAALETVANLMTRLGQAPARGSADPLSQASQTPPAAPASCQKIDLRGNIMYNIIIYCTSFFRRLLILSKNHRVQKFFLGSFHFVILYIHHCSFYVFICLHSTLENDNKLETSTNLANVRCCTCGLFDLGSE